VKASKFDVFIASVPLGDVFKPSNMQTALLPIFFMFLIMKKLLK
jgi:hypothetical protein